MHGSVRILTQQPGTAPGEYWAPGRLMQPVKAYTLNGAYLLRREDKFGSLEVGKFVDLILLDKNILEVPASDIHEATVLFTMTDGKIQFNDIVFSGQPQLEDRTVLRCAGRVVLRRFSCY